jgi:hypothetical protein
VQDASLRNAIIAGVASSLDATHTALRLLDTFVADFMHDPHGKRLRPTTRPPTRPTRGHGHRRLGWRYACRGRGDDGIDHSKHCLRLTYVC